LKQIHPHDMEKSGKLIIIPWDFSQVASNALQHGIKIARNVDNDIQLLNIVKAGTPPHEKEQVNEKLKEVAAETEKKYGLLPGTMVLEGNIFSDIADYASDRKANLVIMGTHGVKGIQKFTGSWAVKVIVGSKVPFLVVQKPPEDLEKYSRIVFPIDFRSENKEKVYMAIYMGKYFDSKIHILKPPVTDRNLLRKVNVNLNFAIKFLIQNNIDYSIHDSRKGVSLAKDTIRFAEEIRADLIMIMTTKNINFSDYLLGVQEQSIIANAAGIPVLCINPKSNYAKVAQFMYG